MKLKVQITPTADGLQEYMQVMSDDMTSVNIVLIAEEIEVEDTRHRDGEYIKTLTAELTKVRRELASATDVLQEVHHRIENRASVGPASVSPREMARDLKFIWKLVKDT